MKKLLASAVILPLAIWAFSSSAGAQGSKKFFDGTTEQGQELFFVIEDIGGTPTFEPFFTTFLITCNNQSFTYSWFFIGFQIPLDQTGFFDINFPSFQTPFDWHGTVSKGGTGNRAKGKQSQGFASYNQDFTGVVDCGTGPVTWTAHGVSSKPSASQHADWIVTLTKHQNGHISETITHG